MAYSESKAALIHPSFHCDFAEPILTRHVPKVLSVVVVVGAIVS